LQNPHSEESLCHPNAIQLFTMKYRALREKWANSDTMAQISLLLAQFDRILIFED
jgi:hypothetical protein